MSVIVPAKSGERKRGEGKMVSDRSMVSEEKSSLCSGGGVDRGGVLGARFLPSY